VALRLLPGAAGVYRNARDWLMSAWGLSEDQAITLLTVACDFNVHQVRATPQPDDAAASDSSSRQDDGRCHKQHTSAACTAAMHVEARCFDLDLICTCVAVAVLLVQFICFSAGGLCNGRMHHIGAAALAVYRTASARGAVRKVHGDLQ
jgi:hypothetical protein